MHAYYHYTTAWNAKVQNNKKQNIKLKSINLSLFQSNLDSIIPQFFYFVIL